MLTYKSDSHKHYNSDEDEKDGSINPHVVIENVRIPCYGAKQYHLWHNVNLGEREGGRGERR